MHDFLRKEQGYTSVNIGDYYVKQCDGNYIVLTAERFNRLFEEINDLNDLLVNACKIANETLGDEVEKDKWKYLQKKGALQK